MALASGYTLRLWDEPLNSPDLRVPELTWHSPFDHFKKQDGVGLYFAATRTQKPPEHEVFYFRRKVRAGRGLVAMEYQNVDRLVLVTQPELKVGGWWS